MCMNFQSQNISEKQMQVEKPTLFCFKITNRFCYFQSDYKNNEVLSIRFKTTSTNVLNRADMWPNLELFFI